MISYKYNETAYAELILKSGFQTKYISTELKILVLYLREVLNLKPKNREKFLIEFCKKNIPNFKREKYYNLINQVLRYAAKKENKLIDIDMINIYQNEVDYINSFNIDYNYKKIMFAFLVQLKLNKIVYEYKNNKEYNTIYFKGGRKKYSNIKKIANVSNKIVIHDDVINELDKLGLIKILHKGIITLEYLKECKQEGDISIIIKDFENIGLYFDYFNGIKGIIECNKCKKPIKQKSNRQLYCEECRNIVEKELRIDINKRYYNKIKTV